jgi:diguanylate cyclase (GGDEF)-like protein
MSAPAIPPPSSADAVLPSRFLKPWLAIQICAAAVVLVIEARSAPIDPAIALPWPGVESRLAVAMGMAFWLIFGLVGGARSRMRAGGSVMTFSMPFIVAGTLLGGPFAGALLGLLSEFELRELRTQPWYGTLANHAVSILSAVAGGTVGALANGLLGQSPALATQPAITFFVVALVTAFTFAATNIALVIPTLAFRHAQGFADARKSNNASFRATSLGEAVLAWLMAVTYVAIGFWAPIACVVLVLIVWQAFDGGEAIKHDPKTGLLNELGFAPMVFSAIDAARQGRRASAVVQLDLDKFKHINEVFLERAGDEVIVEVAKRLLTSVRATDSVARSHLAGDEYYVLFENVGDPDVAVRLVQRLQGRIRQPIRLSGYGVDVELDASAGIVMLELGTSRTKDEVYTVLNSRMKRAKVTDGRVIWEGEETASELDRRAALGSRRPDA